MTKPIYGLNAPQNTIGNGLEIPATIMATSPITATVDGGTNPIPVTPWMPGYSPTVGDRVFLKRIARKYYVVGLMDASGSGAASIIATVRQLPGSGAVTAAASSTGSNTASPVSGYPYPMDTYFVGSFQFLIQPSAAPTAQAQVQLSFLWSGVANEITRSNFSAANGGNSTVTTSTFCTLVPAGTVPTIQVSASNTGAGLAISCANNDVRYWSLQGAVFSAGPSDLDLSIPATPLGPQWYGATMALATMQTAVASGTVLPLVTFDDPFSMCSGSGAITAAITIPMSGRWKITCQGLATPSATVTAGGYWRVAPYKNNTTLGSIAGGSIIAQPLQKYNVNDTTGYYSSGHWSGVLSCVAGDTFQLVAGSSMAPAPTYHNDQYLAGSSPGATYLMAEYVGQ